MKRVVITGATGFVGANLTRRLLQDGHEVHVLVRPGYTPWRIESVRSELQFHELVLDALEVLSATLCRIRPDWVFHLATYGAYAQQANLAVMVETNIKGTIALVQASMVAGCEAIVYAGSSSEYGFKDHAPHEREWLDPNSYYAVTKAAATLFCRYTAQAWEGRLITLRLYSVYGPWEEPTRLVPTLLLHGMRGTLPPLVNPAVARDYVYVDDVCESFIQAARTPGQERGVVYNVGSERQTSIQDLVTLAGRLLPIHAEPQWGSMPDRHWDTQVWLADSSAIRQAIGWQASTTLEHGLSRMIQWFEAHPAMQDYYRAKQQGTR
jgi:dolichol-phosphate mannosyltransferase